LSGCYSRLRVRLPKIVKSILINSMIIVYGFRFGSRLLRSLCFFLAFIAQPHQCSHAPDPFALFIVFRVSTLQPFFECFHALSRHFQGIFFVGLLVSSCADPEQIIRIQSDIYCTISDSIYSKNPSMNFFIEYQAQGCTSWYTVFNALPPTDSGTRLPKTFTQNYTAIFSVAENCRNKYNDGMLRVPYGGKIRVKATHGPLLFFSEEKSLPSI
jgi:hypothetical protein